MSALHDTLASFLPPETTTTDQAWQRTLREHQVLLDNAGVGIVFIRQRLVVRANVRYAEIFGYPSHDDLIGQGSMGFYPDQDAFRALGRSAFPVMSRGKTYHTERQMRRCDGSLFWARLTGTLINPQDTAEGSIWIIDDIDGQKNIEAQLNTALKEKQILLDNALVGMVFLTDQCLVQCNRHFEKMLGYAPGELTHVASAQWYYQEEDRHTWTTRLAQGEPFGGEVLLRKKDGSAVACEIRSQALDPDRPGRGIIWIVLDITERQSAELELAKAHQELERTVQERTQQLRETVDSLHQEINDRRKDQEHIYWLAHYDPLTGLPNRTLLAERSHQAIELARKEQTPLAVIFLDLDHFKHVNDSLGHRVGDALLVAIAQRLQAVVRDRDTVCRVGGDEFILLLPGANAAGAQRVATKLLEASRQPYQIEHHELTIAPSLGIALYPDDGTDFATLNQAADVAMYRAKLDGRNTYNFFTPEMRAQSVRALQLENALRRALERNQFTLHYQPQICIATGQITGVEALLRWQHPELGAISPVEFIPIAEDGGQILPIGEWVLREALRQLECWHRSGLMLETMAVNLSAVQFRQPQFPQLVTRILQERNLPAHVLELELTEGVAMDDPRTAIATMDELHSLGIRLSIDDFGTGYSSLSHLKRFPIYKLKIDRSFVRDLDDDANDRAIVSAIIRMAQALGMKTIAEGVETSGQLAFLRNQGCTEAQGYYHGRPMPAAQLEQLLRTHQGSNGPQTA